MTAIVVRRDSSFFVVIEANGRPCDLAGPFDDQFDAYCAAERAVYGGEITIEKSEDS